MADHTDTRPGGAAISTSAVTDIAGTPGAAAMALAGPFVLLFLLLIGGGIWLSGQAITAVTGDPVLYQMATIFDDIILYGWPPLSVHVWMAAATWLFTCLLFRCAHGLPELAVTGGGRGMRAAWRQTRPHLVSALVGAAILTVINRTLPPLDVAEPAP